MNDFEKPNKVTNSAAYDMWKILYDSTLLYYTVKLVCYIDGEIDVSGNGGSGGGSGGTVFIQAGDLSGSGEIKANGGSGNGGGVYVTNIFNS